MNIKEGLEISEKSLILTELASSSDDLFLEQPGLNKREVHSTYFQSLEIRFNELFDDDNAKKGVEIKRINSLLHDAIIELLDHRITISEQLKPGFLELQRTIQKCMPLNNALTIQGYAEKNQEQLDNDPLYLEGIDNAKKKNALRDTGKIGKIEPPKDGSILYKAITEKISVVCFFQEALAKELYSKNKILTSLIKLKQQDFLDELWLHNTVMNLFRVLEKFNMSEEYQKNPSNVELLNAYFSLLNTIRSNFYHTSFIVKILAAESFLFLSEHRINDFESITERLAFFISYIRKFFDLSHELAFFIKEFALFVNVIDSNKEFMKKMLDVKAQLEKFILKEEPEEKLWYTEIDLRNALDEVKYKGKSERYIRYLIEYNLIDLNKGVSVKMVKDVVNETHFNCGEAWRKNNVWRKTPKI